MAIKYLAGKRLQGTAAERTALNIASPPTTSWKELGRTTLSGTSDTIEVTSLEAKDNMMILSHNIVTSDHNMTWSTGTGSYSGSYADRRSENGGSDSTTINRTTNGIISDAHTKNMFTVGNLLNTDGQEKLVNWSVVGHNADGAGNAPDRFETVGKFTGTSQINQIKLNNSSSINNEIGSELVVLGYDNDEADSGTNFWQELASVELSATANEIDSGTFTAKKYLMVELQVIADGSISGSDLQFNGDTGSNYARRYRSGGDSEATATSEATLGGGTGGDRGYNTWFIVNVADKEKLAIGEATWASNGAGNAPSRRELTGKWANTSAQITSIKIKENASGGWASGSTLKVWGSD